MHEPVMASLLQDVRYALRMLRRSPGFTAAAVAILAIGIGFNAAVFSLIDAVVLSPLPGAERPQELVELATGQHSVFSYPSYSGLRAGSRVFSGLAAWGSRSLGLSGGGGAAERIRANVVSANYFDVLGVRPSLGRFFLPDEEESGAARAVISEGLWQRRFGRSRAAAGGVLQLNGTPFTVVGVAPRGFRGAAFGQPPDLWIPVGAWPRVATGALARLGYNRRSWGWMSIFGRLAPGVSAAQAAAAANAIAEREAREFPKDVSKDRIDLIPLSRAAAGARDPADPIRFFGMLLGALTVALLIACSNLANLQLARALARRKEIAVRQALGAGRGRLVRQMLTESIVLALAGGAAGLLVAYWSVELASRVHLPGGMTLAVFGPSLNGRVLLYAFLLSVATGTLFGLVPAFQASRVALVPALKEETPGHRRAVLRSVLVAAQVAFCLVLLACAGLFARSLGNALATDPGFSTRGLALASVHLGLARYDAPRAWSFAREAAARVAALPGVRAVSWAGLLPLSGERDVETVTLPGAAPGPPQEVDVTAVGPAYFRTLGIPIVAGREFDASNEGPDGAPAIVVNEAAARRFWHGENPIGRRLQIYGAERSVVGVSRDSLFLSLQEPGLSLVTVPIQQLGGDGILAPMTLLVRTDGDPRAALPAVKAAIGSLDANLPVFGLRTLADEVADQLLPQRFGSALLGLFALLSLVLATLGVYAVVAASVSRRVREMGIRIALGARPAALRRMILRQTTVPVAAGIAAGLPLAVGATRLLGRFLFGVTPTDAASFAAAALLLALGGLAAADWPARRAGSISPMEALRNE